MKKLLQGTVWRSTGSWYTVKLSDHRVIECRVPGKFRLQGLPLTNPVAVGDLVQIELETDQKTGVIRQILDRKNYVIRESPRRRLHVHLLASNIDQAVLITTMINPQLKPAFIDRFLLMTQTYRIPTLIVFNKADSYRQRDMEKLIELEEVYQAIGYTILCISAFHPEDICTLKDLLRNKRSLLSGHSGVGKTTLINRLIPGVELKVMPLAKQSGKGRHTTTYAEMYALPFGGEIIDTPGIKNLSFNHLRVQDVQHNFIEIFEHSRDCRFGDCRHKTEPGCAVIKAVESGAIYYRRYQNYLKIIEEIEGQNYWERLENV